MKVISKKFLKECHFNPTQIGISLLKNFGYEVEEYLNWEGQSIYVYDYTGKLMFWK